MAAKSPELAEAIAAAISRFDPGLMLFGLSGSELVRAGESAGLRTASEVFADRTYERDGSLTPRQQPDALITDLDQAARHVIRMVQESRVLSRQGVDVPIRADTVCLHGDAPQAVPLARRLRESLESSGIAVRAFQARAVESPSV